MSAEGTMPSKPLIVRQGPVIPMKMPMCAAGVLCREAAKWMGEVHASPSWIMESMRLKVVAVGPYPLATTRARPSGVRPASSRAR